METLAAIKRSIRLTPVTMSALSMGILVIPMIILLPLLFINCIPVHAAVPRIVARSADKKASTMVVRKAAIISSFSMSSRYQEKVKPPQRDLYLLSLKDRIIKVAMGA